MLVEVSLVEAELWAGEVSLIAEELKFRFLGAPDRGWGRLGYHQR